MKYKYKIFDIPVGDSNFIGDYLNEYAAKGYRIVQWSRNFLTDYLTITVEEQVPDEDHGCENENFELHCKECGHPLDDHDKDGCAGDIYGACDCIVRVKK